MCVLQCACVLQCIRVAACVCCSDDNLNPMVRVAVRVCVAACVWRRCTFSRLYVCHAHTLQQCATGVTHTATVFYGGHTHCNSVLREPHTLQQCSTYVTLSATEFYKCHAHAATVIYIDSALHPVCRRPIGYLVSCRSFSAKELLITGLFCGKRPETMPLSETIFELCLNDFVFELCLNDFVCDNI